MSANNGDDRIAGLARFTPDGQLDTGFATDGYFMHYYGGANRNHVFYDMQWHQGNNLLMAGVIARINHNGYIARVIDVYDPAEITNNNHLKINLYPNPARQYVHLQTEVPLQNIAIYTTGGQLVRNSPQTDMIDVSGLAAGVYLIHIQTEKGKLVKKLVKM
jgi:hypothetical protein